MMVFSDRNMQSLLNKNDGCVWWNYSDLFDGTTATCLMELQRSVWWNYSDLFDGTTAICLMELQRPVLFTTQQDVLCNIKLIEFVVLDSKRLSVLNMMCQNGMNSAKKGSLIAVP